MTNKLLESLEKIRKLPKLKKGYKYDVEPNGRVWIENDIRPLLCLYYNHKTFVKNGYYWSLKTYKEYLANPIYEDGELVGFE